MYLPAVVEDWWASFRDETSTETDFSTSETSLRRALRGRGRGGEGEGEGGEGGRGGEGEEGKEITSQFACVYLILLRVYA